MALMVPCLSCGALTPPNPLSRCEPCATKFHRVQPARESVSKPSSARRGYDSRWRRLSELARRLQPFCVDCGATSDLQADHSPEAWARRDAGKPIRLQDIDVVCGDCNRRRGPARGPGARGRRGRRGARRVGG